MTASQQPVAINRISLSDAQRLHAVPNGSLPREEIAKKQGKMNYCALGHEAGESYIAPPTPTLSHLMNNYGSMTNPSESGEFDGDTGGSTQERTARKPVVALMVSAVLAVLFVSMSVSSAQDDAPVLVPTEDTEQLEGLVSLVQQQQQQIEVLEEQLAFARQAVIQSEGRLDTQRDTILDFQQSDIRSVEEQAAAMDQWRLGYRIGGGSYLTEFENVILPCESGSQPDPFTAVGPTDDWGRAQINRPVWGNRFEQLTGVVFEDGILDPMLNGYMAAVVEQEHSTGLNAWTCWRRRR